MKKIKLDLDRLHVTSFTTDGTDGRSGTVRGHWISDEFTCGSCGGGGSRLDDSCGATCGGVCGPQTKAMHGCTIIE